MQKPIPKPITDHYVPFNFKQAKIDPNNNERSRTNDHPDDQPKSTFTKLEEKVLLEKWSRYQSMLIEDQRKRMEIYKRDQVEAMLELKECSQYLYEMAGRPDNGLKIHIKGAVSGSPKKDYEKDFVPIGEIDTFES